MKNILGKITILILLMLIIHICLPNMTYAMDNVISGGDGFIAARDNKSPIDEEALKTTSDYIYNILFTIAVVLAVAIGMVIGIQFMLGSAEEQAKVKETLVPYVIGVFVVFASFTIWKIVVNIGNDIEGEGEQIVNRNNANTYDEVFAITESQINSMDKTELENYLNKVNTAIIEENAFAFNEGTQEVEDNERIRKLQERKKYVIDEINSRPIDIPNYTGEKSETMKEFEEKYKDKIEEIMNP